MAHGNTEEGLLDHAFGSLDESIHRQIDEEPGGGFADESAAFLWGFGDWAAGDVDDTIGNVTDKETILLAAAILGGSYVAAKRYA